METATLVKTAMEAVGNPSLRAFAAKVGVSHQSVTRWLDGTAVPTFEQCMELAELAGLDQVRTAAAVRLNSKDAVRHRRLLRRLAQAAACFILAIALPYRASALEAPARAVAAFSGSHPIHYAHSSFAAVWRVLSGFLTFLAGFFRWRSGPLGPLAGSPA